MLLPLLSFLHFTNKPLLPVSLLSKILSTVMSSTIDPSCSPLKPIFTPSDSDSEPEQTRALIQKLDLEPHPEGGYFRETDRDPFKISNPFALQSEESSAAADLLVDTRNASTTIFYLMTPDSRNGVLFRNKARTIHTLHRGRGRYIVIHADEVACARGAGGYADRAENLGGEDTRWTGKARIETFVVGPNVLQGEKVQWIVEGGKYKASYLLPDEEGGSSSEGMLISETVVPGFEWADHDFMSMERLEALVTKEQKEELEWMIKKA